MPDQDLLDQGQLAEFAERGFLVVPRAVPPDLVATASQVIDELIDGEPPGPEVREPHNYFPEAAQAPALAALLMDSTAFALAESLTGPGSLEARAGVPSPAPGRSLGRDREDVRS
ncbi:hypothetical protein ACWD6R_10790 [Streptomyces sp. NPDC005151]